MSITTIVTGGNLGNRYESLSEAARLVEIHIGDVLAKSAFYESDPWGFNSELPFLNQALVVSTKFSPHDLLAKTKHIEQQLGREEKTVKGNYCDRLVDIDIIFYNNLILYDAPELIIPHPMMHKRRFVLEPINEIASKMIHPIKKLSVCALLHACVDESTVMPAQKM